jgi:signal transduction histidine kinase
MAMQHSEELSETAGVLFGQMVSLDIVPKRCAICIINQNKNTASFWLTTFEGTVIPGADLVPLTEEKHLIQVYQAWKNKKTHFSFKLVGEDRIIWTKYIMNKVKMHVPEYQPENINQEQLLNEPAVFNFFFFTHGFIMIHTVNDLDEKDLPLFKRFTGVFEQSYTRFLDLKNAEEQAREAKIEASLERARSKSMAMHNPDDLSESVSVFFKELKSLNVLPWRCGVGQIDEETKITTLTTTSITKSGESIEVTGKLKQEGHPVLDGIFEHWKLQKEYYPVLRGDDIKKYYDIIKPQIAFPEYPLDAVQYGHTIFFKEGFVFAWTENKLSEEELQIFRRFTSVLSLTYRRYMDLKEAEARAVEAVRQASLDRVRAEIASMRTAEDLNHITPVIWRELKTLDVPFIRCGVYIVDEADEKVQVYLTTPDGKSLAVLNLNFDANELTSNSVQYWREKNIYTEHWTKEQFVNWTKSMIEQGQIQNAETYQGSADPPETLDLYFVPFKQGMLYVGNTSQLTEEKLQTVASLAEAFSIAYARYEDFKNIEEAKNRTEITLNELKSAQTQLIHSEKMASLGVLTAGIAHEIKNPLNFVNNFSEVSNELLDELKTELQNKNIEQVIEIVESLKQNLEKISNHGKRADSIVKGMLLHSRGTSGEKVLTNINDLLDQYVNLAYHGMRAQNKEFNITIEKDYDKTLEKINVIPQDICRVFLNIINNACYAAYDKKKKNSNNNFSPTLRVSTKEMKGKVEIRIGDNGNGIPVNILDKIFQPFFTTKPTGEGTGLGLSLSYDIVTKVHGGELKVETKDGEGTGFIILLPISQEEI